MLISPKLFYSLLLIGSIAILATYASGPDTVVRITWKDGQNEPHTAVIVESKVKKLSFDRHTSRIYRVFKGKVDGQRSSWFVCEEYDSHRTFLDSTNIFQADLYFKE